MQSFYYEEQHSQRLDVYLTSVLKQYTRSYIHTLIECGKITVDKKSVKCGYSLKKGNIIEVQTIETKELNVMPKKIDINIIYEDDDVILVNKEKGMVVHPGNGNTTDTIVNSLLYSHRDKLSSINGVVRPGIVHRIDKDTTGVLVIAKNDNAHKVLSQQFKDHSIKREYVALVKGIVKQDEVTIDKPVGRNPKDRKKMGIVPLGRRAVTHISVIARYYNSGITYIKATLETGRTHQIRVHMKAIGYPLLGDLTYGTKEKEFKLETHVLHAKLLGFVHPTSGTYMEFDSTLPSEFEDILLKLEKKEN